MCTSPRERFRVSQIRSPRAALSRRLAACALVLALGAPSLSLASEPRSAWEEAGLGFAAVGCSLFYSTAKVLYAGLGTFTGLLALGLTGGRWDTFETIVNPAVRGEYIVTPEHFTEKRFPIFFGPYPEDLEQYPAEAEGEGEPQSGEETSEPAPYPF
jgi:hypothetical protein